MEAEGKIGIETCEHSVAARFTTATTITTSDPDKTKPPGVKMGNVLLFKRFPFQTVCMSPLLLPFSIKVSVFNGTAVGKLDLHGQINEHGTMLW